MNLTMKILEKFGEAKSQFTNLQKNGAFLIRCKQSKLARMERTLPCAQADFPTTYFELPISNKNFSKSDLLPWIENLGEKLSGWKPSS